MDRKGTSDEDPDYLDAMKPLEQAAVETQAGDGAGPIPYPDLPGGDLGPGKVDPVDGPIDVRPGETDPDYSNGPAKINDGVNFPTFSSDVKVEGSGVTPHLSAGVAHHESTSNEDSQRDDTPDEPTADPEPEPEPDPDPSNESLTGSEVDIDALLDRTDAFGDPDADPVLSAEPQVADEGDLEAG